MTHIVRSLQPSDAAALSACIERCYGDTYPNSDFYDPQVLTREIAEGTLRSVAAVTPAGEVVGHTSFALRDPEACVVEAGVTVVDPACRGQGLLAELGAALHARCSEEGFAGFVHYPTTAHELMQRSSVGFGGVETGVMLAYVPAETDYVAVGQPAGRLATTVAYQPIAPLRERAVLLPERHAALLESLYSEIGAPRTGGQARGARKMSSLRSSRSAREKILRVMVGDAGDDLGHVVASLCDGADVAHVDLLLDDPGVERAVEGLAELGFFFGALLPEFGRTDVLRLQRLAGQPPSAFRPQLANPGARRLLAYIDEDRITA